MFVLGGICPATCEISSGTKWISKTDLFFYVLLFFSNFPQRKHYNLQPWSLFLCESLCKDSFRGTYTLLDSPQWGEIKAVKGGKQKKKKKILACVGWNVRKKRVFEAQVRSLSF